MPTDPVKFLVVRFLVITQVPAVERADGEGGEITYEFEVTQYNLLGPVWNSIMRPDYGSVTEMLY